jgi:hypothetical protein
MESNNIDQVIDFSSSVTSSSFFRRRSNNVLFSSRDSILSTGVGENITFLAGRGYET